MTDENNQLYGRWPMIPSGIRTVGYVRVSTDKQADKGASLDAQAQKIRAMAVVHGAELLDVIVDGGESAGSLKWPGMAKLLALVDAGNVRTVIVAPAYPVVSGSHNR